MSQKLVRSEALEGECGTERGQHAAGVTDGQILLPESVMSGQITHEVSDLRETLLVVQHAGGPAASPAMPGNRPRSGGSS